MTPDRFTDKPKTFKERSAAQESMCRWLGRAPEAPHGKPQAWWPPPPVSR